VNAVPYIALLVCIAGTLTSLISIMAFFLGTDDAVIRPFIWLQVALALILLPMAAVSITELRRYDVSVTRALRATPAWLIVAIGVVLILMLLGELSVLIARVKVNEVTAYLDHLPSLCIVVYCASFWLHSMMLLTRPANPFRGT